MYACLNIYVDVMNAYIHLSMCVCIYISMYVYKYACVISEQSRYPGNWLPARRHVPKTPQNGKKRHKNVKNDARMKGKCCQKEISAKNIITVPPSNRIKVTFCRRQ